MDFGSVGQRKPIIGSSADRNSPQLSYSIGSSLDRTKKAVEEDLVELGKDYKAPYTRSGQYLQLNQVKSAVDVAKDAFDKIYEIRSRQLELVDEARNTATGAKTEALDEEYRSLDTEITRIVNSATVAGKNVLTDAPSYALSESNNGVENVISLPNAYSALNVDPNESVFVSKTDARFASQEEADTYYDYSVDNFSVLSSMKADIDSAAEKADKIAKETLVPLAARPDALQSVESAAELAAKIANDLGGQFSKEKSAQNLIEITTKSLEPEKVKRLLTDQDE